MVAAVAELLMFKLGHCEIQFRPLRDKIGSAHKTYRDLGPIQETWRDPLDQKSAPGQSRRFDCVPPTSALPPSTDIVRSARQVRFVPTAEMKRLVRSPDQRAAWRRRIWYGIQVWGERRGLLDPTARPVR